MSIPIRNYYYLLCYAWDRLEESAVVRLGASDYRHIADLFARVLARGVEHLLKRGLDQGYVEHHEIRAGIRGKLDFATSLKGNLFAVGKAACVFEELSHDVPHNRILKATLSRLLRTSEIDPALQRELKVCQQRFGEVANIRLSKAVFGSVQLHSNNGFYDFLLHVCRLIYNMTVVDEADGKTKFKDFERDDAAMAALFEKFILNFYRREQTQFGHVWSEGISWQDTSASESDMAFLPQMRTDVSLESATRKIVLDAKYYREATQQRFGSDKVRSGHLYQLFAYLRNLHRASPNSAAPEGILLYPLVDKPLDLRFRLHGHAIRVKTIDLAAEWREIHDGLLSLLEPAAALQKIPNGDIR